MNVEYAAFGAAVMKAAGHMCEVPSCDADADGVHHFLKQSTHPGFKHDPCNGMAICGRCHSEVERRLREGGDEVEMYPIGRYRMALALAGVDVPEGMEPPRMRDKRASALERRAREIRAGQLFLDGAL